MEHRSSNQHSGKAIDSFCLGVGFLIFACLCYFVTEAGAARKGPLFTPVFVYADLALTKTGSSGIVPVGGTLTYTLSATNNGPESATGVIVTDPLPASVTLLSATANPGTCSGTPLVRCNLGSLANGATATVTLVVTTTIKTMNLTNTASVTANELDPNQTNNTAALTSIVDSSPVTANQNVSTNENVPLTLTLTGSDPDGDALNFAIVSNPNPGSLGTISPPSCNAGTCQASVTYTPSSNYIGSDSFIFSVSDGISPSALGAVSLTVYPVNQPPVAISQTLTALNTVPATATPITLSGSDLETPAANLTYAIVAGKGPAHGVLAGTAPQLTYQPNAGYTGPDSFDFTVTDTGNLPGCSGGPPSCASPLTTHGTISITIQQSFQVAISLAGTGLGTVRSTPAGITCGTTCSAFFPAGQVTLFANADSTSVFTQWAGNCTSISASTCTITVTDKTAIAAYFYPTGVSRDPDGDGIDSSIDTQPSTPSNDFNDTASGGTTAGKIIDRGTWSVTVSPVVPPPGFPGGSRGVLVSITGISSTPARIAACPLVTNSSNGVLYVESLKEIQLSQAGDTALLSCTGSYRTVQNALLVALNLSPENALPLIMKEAATTTIQICQTILLPFGRGTTTRCTPTSTPSNTTVNLSPGQTFFLGSLLGTASNNTVPLTGQLLDQNNVPFGSFSLDPGATLDLTIPTPEAINAVMLTGTATLTVGGQSAALTTGQVQGFPTKTLSSISVTPTTASINIGQSLQFTATGMFSDGSSRLLTGGSSLGTWTTQTPIPAPSNGVGTVVDGKLYVIGGLSGGTAVGTVQVYDPITNTWSSKSPMPTARANFGIGVVNGTIYTVGGVTGNGATIVATVEVYDPTTDTWSTKAPMPSPTTQFGVGVVNGILYAVGGYGSPDSIATVVAYDPTANTWSPRSSMATGRNLPAVAVIDGLLYAFGGTVSGTFLSSMEVYNPTIDTWTRVAAMPTGRMALSTGVVNGSLYAVGGYNGSDLATVEAYDPAADHWTTMAPLSVARQHPAVGVANGLLYAAGGTVVGGNSPSIVEAFTPPLPPLAVWTSSDPSIATINADGFATGVSAGTVTFTATAGGLSCTTTSACAMLTVVQPDTIPPTSSAAPSPTPNVNGWNNATVSVTLTATDNPGGSGVQSITYALTGAQTSSVVVPANTASFSISAEGTTTVTFHATDIAGNVEGTKSLTVMIDKTSPTLIFGTATPAPNAVGWNNTSVSVPFTATDALSGVAIITPAASPLVLTAEGTTVTGTVTVTDKADNSATFTTSSFMIDKTPPTLTMPALAASYTLDASVTLTFSATDALSGVATSQGTLNGTPITNGNTVTLTQPGSNTFTLKTTDQAGNTTTQNSNFSVRFSYSGYLQPIPNDGSGVFKLGSTVPVKFQLTDATGAFVSTAVAHLTVQPFSGNAPSGTAVDAMPNGGADTGNLFRYDSTSQQYIFNLSTKPLTTGTWQLQVALNDGTTHTVLIGLK